MKNYIFLFIILYFGLVGCDPHSTNRKVVSNISNYEIKVTEYAVNKSVMATYNIKSNSEGVIFDVSALGGAATNCKFLFGDSLATEVVSTEPLKVKKNLNLDDSWVRDSKGNNMKGYTVECKATITNADIVPK